MKSRAFADTRPKKRNPKSATDKRVVRLRWWARTRNDEGLQTVKAKTQTWSQAKAAAGWAGLAG